MVQHHRRGEPAADSGQEGFGDEMKRILAAVGLATAFAGAGAGVAKADYVWDGPRFTAQTIYGVGNATYVFNTDGFFNDNPGDTFSHPVSGLTFGLGGGYDWRRDTGHDRPDRPPVLYARPGCAFDRAPEHGARDTRARAYASGDHRRTSRLIAFQS